MKPSVLFASCTQDSPTNLIKLMMGELPEAGELEKGIVSYPWHIDSKYYKADIQLCSMESKIISSPDFANSVQGVVLYFDSEQPDSLMVVDEWLVLLKEYQAEIKILVCPQCKEKSEHGVNKLQVQEWCLKEEFELVELNPITDDDDSGSDDFPEATGIKRVCQALEAHIWPNLTLKNRKEPTCMANLLNGGVCLSTGSDYESASYIPGEDNIEPSLEDICDKENVEFCELFSQLASMKERASNMPSNERKAFAEQLVLAYWNALGGDEDQILDC